MIGALVLAAAFHYTLPPGWIDLADPAVDASSFPMNAVEEARSGKYRIYAIDPDNLTDRGAGAIFNVIENPQTAAITKPVLESSMKVAESLARARGYTWTTLHTDIGKIGDVDVGIAESTLGNELGTLHLMQYFVPGRDGSAMLTYGCRPEQFDDYRSIFTTSAMATTGAYSRTTNWSRLLTIVLLVAVIATALPFLGIAVVRRARVQ